MQLNPPSTHRPRPARHLLALLLIALAAAGLTRAPQSASAADPGAARWRFAGLQGEPVNAIAIAHDSPALIYAVTGGDNVPSPYPYIHRSIDAAASWETVYRATQFDHLDVAIDPTDNQVIYVGDVHMLLKSIDGGASWVALPSITGASPTSIAVRPDSPQTLFVGVEYGWGVYRSTDGGRSYRNLLPQVYVTDLALDSGSSTTIYAASRDYISGERLITPGGIHRSGDGGASWTRVLTHTAVLRLLLDPRDPQVIYAGTEGDGVLKSSDGGATWASASAGLRHPIVQALAMSPASSQVLYAGTWEGGVYKSRDGGTSWSQLNEGLGNRYVLSLAVDPADPTVLYAGTRGGGIFKYAGPPLPGPDELYAHVVDAAGEPVAGARVFHNGRELRDPRGGPLVTDAAGNLVLSGVRPGDTLVAAALQHEQPTARAGHAGWAYRIFTTSLQVGADGAVRPHAVAGSVGPQTLTVRPAGALVLFNLLVSVEWDADGAYLAELKAGMERASDLLFDMSDGQMALGAVTIADRAMDWGEADVQIATANIVRPHAFVGGISADDKAYVIRLGRGWDGRTGAQGSWAAESGYRTIAHEFGHYGLFLRDEYFGYEQLPGGGLGGEVPAACTDAATRALAAPGAAASVMDDQYQSSELSQQGVAGLWSASCALTAQWQLNGESAWATLARHYADPGPSPRWRLTTPADRGAALAGPAGLPATALALPEVSIKKDTTTAGRRTLTVVTGPDRQPVRGAIVAIQKPDGRVIGQGLTDPGGALVLYGAEPGDLLRATSFDGGLFGKLTVGAETSLTLSLSSVAGRLAQGGGLNPHLLAVAQPAAGGQVELLISLEHFGPGADPFLAVNAPNSTVGNAPPLSYSPGKDVYRGSFAFAATERGSGSMRADRRVSGERPTLQATYRLQRVESGRAQEVLASDGHLALQLPPGSLPGAESYVVVMSPGAAPGAPPAGMALVGEAYAVTASGAVAALERPAALTLSYDRGLVGGPPPQGLAIYRWDPVAAGWQPVAGRLDDERGAVSATVTALGIYGLMAPSGPWEAPGRTTWLPAVRR